MKAMNDLELAEKKINDWISSFDLLLSNQYVFEKVKNTSPSLNIELAIKICDICGAELYWLYANSELGSFEKIIRGIMTTNAENFLLADKRIQDMKVKILQNVDAQEKCPICGGILSHNYGEHFFFRIRDFDYKDLKYDRNIVLNKWKNRYRVIKKKEDERRIENDKEKGEIMLNATLMELSESVSDSETISIPVARQDIISSTSGLCDYLLHAMELEQNIITTEKRMKVLFDKLPKVQREAKQVEGKQLRAISELVENKEEEVKKKIREISGLTYKDFGLEVLTFPQIPNEPVSPKEPIYETPGVFNKKKVINHNAALEAKYRDALNKYEKEKEIYAHDLKEYEKTCEDIKQKNSAVEEKLNNEKNNIIKQIRHDSELEVEAINNNLKELGSDYPEAVVENMLLDEVELAKDTYKQLLIARRNYYMPDIVFEKYRNLAALSTIYEYLKSGRCTELTGADGAYNIYESELRSNIIISKLDTVLEKLEEIKNSQYVLCNVMQSINTNLSKINNKFDDVCSYLSSISNDTSSIKQNSESIKNNTAVIAYNTEKTAFYSKMTASISAAMLLGF